VGNSYVWFIGPYGPPDGWAYTKLDPDSTITDAIRLLRSIFPAMFSDIFFFIYIFS
jgi:hypothetical protein